LEIIKAHALYPDLNSNGAMVGKIRKDIKLETIDVNIMMADRQRFATIAFTLSYQHENPEKAKQVTDILSIFLLKKTESRVKSGRTPQRFSWKKSWRISVT
jgi:hypothetical protein